MRVELTVPFEDIFPTTEKSYYELVSLLQQLSRTDTIITIGRLNLKIHDPFVRDQFAKQYFAVGNFLGDEEAKRLYEFVQRHRGIVIRPFTRAGLLEMLRWITLIGEDHPDDGNTFQDPRLRKIFGKAALLASDLWQDRVYTERLSSEGGDLGEARKRSLTAIRQGIAEASYEVDPLRTLGRGLLLY